MSGMDRHTGLAIARESHIVQSIGDILSTAKGSRVMRRDYGVDLSIIDVPISPVTVVDVFALVAEALAAWEPRFALRRVQIVEAEPGRVVVMLAGEIAGIARVFTRTIGGIVA